MASSFDLLVYASISDPVIFRLKNSTSSLWMSSRLQYSSLISSLKPFHGVALAAANPSNWTCAFHQVNAAPSSVPVAYFTLRSSGQSHISKTDSSFSNQ
ncbi:hypothetical protein HanIR_Chr01g0010681 [Helianthus annuus]|nr:hypothetical protein HanIR_Chr01g0010681 [Helianthus annuus]